MLSESPLKRVGEIKLCIYLFLFTNTVRKIVNLFTTWSIAEKQKLRLADWFVFYLYRSVCFWFFFLFFLFFSFFLLFFLFISFFFLFFIFFSFFSSKSFYMYAWSMFLSIVNLYGTINWMLKTNFSIVLMVYRKYVS